MTRDELQNLLARHLYILDKDKRKIRFKPNKIQRHLLSQLTGRDLIVKPRQVGISTLLQSRLNLKAWTRPISALTLSYDDDGTQLLRRMSENFYLFLPDYFDYQGRRYAKPRRKYSSAKLVSYPDTMSEMITATAGSRVKGRGGTFTDIHASEVAFWNDPERMLAAVLEAGEPEAVLESTPNGAQGYFYELCMEALDGNSVWTLHFYAWWWHDEYQIPLEPGETLEPYTDDEIALITKHGLKPEQIKWRREKIKARKHLFAQEYPEDPRECFLLSGQGYFGALAGVFAAPMNAEYIHTHKYVAGLDWGQANDYTVLSVWDVTAKRQVDLLRVNRLSWGEMRRQIAVMARKWHVKLIVAEKNAQTANIEELRNLFEGDWEKPAIVEFETTNVSKAAALAELHEAINEDGWKMLDIPEQKREFQAFQAKPSGNGWKYSAPDGEHDDTVIAAALALHGAFHSGVLSDSISVPQVLTEHFLGDA